MFTIASLGALRRFDDQGNWLTTGHAVITVQDEAALPGLVTDAEVGQTVFCETEETMWVFNGTAHVKVGSEPVAIYSVVSIPNVDRPNGYISIFDFLDDTITPMGSVAVLNTNIGFSHTQLPNMQWFDMNRVDINSPTWIVIPAGTMIQKTATNVVRERFRPSGWITVNHQTGTGPGTATVNFNWNMYSRYRMTLELGNSSLEVSAPPGLWEGVQNSSDSGSSRYRVTGTTLGPQGRWTGTITVMHHFGSLDVTLAPDAVTGEFIRIDGEAMWLTPSPTALTLTVASGDYNILVEAHA